MKLAVEVEPEGEIAVDYSSNSGKNKDESESTVTQDPPNTYLDTLGVHEAWALGLDGSGIGVAVIDSGIQSSDDFSNLVKRVGFNSQSNSVNDFYGHGTHVAGIIAGNGLFSGGYYQGIAPGVSLIGLKISDDLGMSYESDVVAAMQWVYDHKDEYNIRVVNLSINSTVESSYHVSPMDAAAEILWFSGVVVVASSGNTGGGDGYNTVNAAPANDPFIITVGATDERDSASREDDFIASYTAAGLTQDGVAKPEIVAPGTDIISVLSGHSLWYWQHPDRIHYAYRYFRLSGTSMAAPMVTGGGGAASAG